MLRRAVRGSCGSACACPRAVGVRGHLHRHDERRHERRRAPGSLAAGDPRQQLGRARVVNTIDFNLTLSNSVITPATSLPPITGQVTIDGIPAVDGPQHPRDRRLVRRRHRAAVRDPVRRSGAGSRAHDHELRHRPRPRSDSVLVAGNFIGTDSAGTAGLGNGDRHRLLGGVLIGGTTAADRNVISDNQTGISVTGGVGAVIEGNYIGTTPTVKASSVEQHRHRRQRRLGRDDRRHRPGRRNVISGLYQDAIPISSTTGDVVQGNLIGPNASQSAVHSGDTAVESRRGRRQQHDRQRSAPVRT